MNFCTAIKNQWQNLDETKRTSLKCVSFSIITAVAFSVIALIVRFTVHGQPMNGWTVDSLLLVTAVPIGLAAITIQLSAACLIPFLKRQESKLKKIALKEAENWCEGLKVPVDSACSAYRDVIVKNGDDLISILRKFKDANLKPTNEEREIFLIAPILNPLTEEEKQLCIEFGIDPATCWLLHAKNAST